MIHNLKNNSTKEIFRLFVRFLKEEKLYNNLKSSQAKIRILENRLKQFDVNNASPIYLVNSLCMDADFKIINKWETILLKQITTLTKKEIIINFFKKYYTNQYDYLLGLFKVNLAKTSFRHQIKNLDEYLNTIPLNDFFNQAFLWSNTTQGHAYWNNINDNYKTYIKYLTINLIKEKYK